MWYVWRDIITDTPRVGAAGININNKSPSVLWGNRLRECTRWISLVYYYVAVRGKTVGGRTVVSHWKYEIRTHETITIRKWYNPLVYIQYCKNAEELLY